MSVETYTDDRFDGRFSVFVTYQPWGDDDPIPYLATIHDAADGSKRGSWWRGSVEECIDQLTDWVNGCDEDGNHGDD